MCACTCMCVHAHMLSWTVKSDSLQPMDCSLLGSSVYGIFQARIPEQVSTPFSRGSSWPKDQTHVSQVSCHGRSFISAVISSGLLSGFSFLLLIQCFPAPYFYWFSFHQWSRLNALWGPSKRLHLDSSFLSSGTKPLQKASLQTLSLVPTAPLFIRLFTQWFIQLFACYFCSVTVLCLTLHDPTNCSTPGFLVLHYLSEFAQVHVCWVMLSNHLIFCRLICLTNTYWGASRHHC